jgi:hypothetical protein
LRAVRDETISNQAAVQVVWDKLKSYIQKANELGVPLATVRDPATGRGSISATLVVVSSIAVLASLVTSKVSNSGAFEMFLASCSLYFGRKFQTKSGTSVDNKTT